MKRTIWWDGQAVTVIDQRYLPHRYVTRRWRTVDDAAEGIRVMQVRGAPLIGVAAAHGVALAMAVRATDQALDAALAQLTATRPTAVNLRNALERIDLDVRPRPLELRAAAARVLSERLADEDAAACRAIGEIGSRLIRDIADRVDRPVQVMTHCNAGWLACVEWGTATAPVYIARERGLAVHVWVSETRPRNQGAALTAWELGQRHVPHTVVVDNAAGHLLRSGLVDVVIVGADRIAANGDVANKVGTYLKALAARDCDVPFYVAAPTTTFDLRAATGAVIPIEERGPNEVTKVYGRADSGHTAGVTITPADAEVRNWAFDVTPARLVSGFLTERGLIPAAPVRHRPAAVVTAADEACGACRRRRRRSPARGARPQPGHGRQRRPAHRRRPPRDADRAAARRRSRSDDVVALDAAGAVRAGERRSADQRVAAARRGARRPAGRRRRRPHALAGGHRGRLPPSQPPGRALRRRLDGEAGRAVRGLRDVRLGRARRQRGRRARRRRRVPHGQPRPARRWPRPSIGRSPWPPMSSGWPASTAWRPCRASRWSCPTTRSPASPTASAPTANPPERRHAVDRRLPAVLVSGSHLQCALR